jgi:hypothetical protein
VTALTLTHRLAPVSVQPSAVLVPFRWRDSRHGNQTKSTAWQDRLLFEAGNAGDLATKVSRAYSHCEDLAFLGTHALHEFALKCDRRRTTGNFSRLQPAS